MCLYLSSILVISKLPSNSLTAYLITQNSLTTLRTLYQAIESVFQQDSHQAGSLDNLSKSVLVEKGQARAMSALTELRKISNLLSEM